MNQEQTGGCQCGAVRYTLGRTLPPAYACHCGECKKQSASAFSMSVPLQFADVSVLGDVSNFVTKAHSGKTKYNYFCGQCGTRLWHSATNPPGSITLKVGTLDDASGISPSGHLWVSKKQPWIMLDPNRNLHQTQPEDLEIWRANLENMK